MLIQQRASPDISRIQGSSLKRGCIREFIRDRRLQEVCGLLRTAAPQLELCADGWQPISLQVGTRRKVAIQVFDDATCALMVAASSQSQSCQELDIPGGTQCSRSRHSKTCLGKVFKLRFPDGFAGLPQRGLLWEIVSSCRVDCSSGQVTRLF